MDGTPGPLLLGGLQPQTCQLSSEELLEQPCRDPWELSGGAKLR